MTSKKRKLEYIREKNHYRKGGKAIGFIKVSIEMLEDVDFLEYEMVSESSVFINKLQCKFKMRFRVCEISRGMIEDDFIRNLTTIRFYLKTINYD